MISKRLWMFAVVCLSLLVGAMTVGNGRSHTTVLSQTAFCQQPFQSVGLPLNDLGSGEYSRDGVAFTGGLYPNGSNSRPSVHNTAGITLANQIVPLNENGLPAADGKIVMITVGMSNTFLEFNAFEDLAATDTTINPHVVLVNGAFAGQTSDKWVDPNSENWTLQLGRLDRRNVTAAQVQVAWIKQTRTNSGGFPDKARLIQADLEAISRNLKHHYPNIKIAYFSSRTRSYTHWNGLSPEPVAFESGFSVKWLIEKQINGDMALNYDPANGPVVAPYLAWGAYLWADGQNLRSDGFTWQPEDMVPDCTHPSDQGSGKVAQLLMDFFKEDETAVPWFLAPVELLPRTYLPFIATAR